MLGEHLVDETALCQRVSIDTGEQVGGEEGLHTVFLNNADVGEYARHGFAELLLSCVGMADEGEADAEVLERCVREFGTAAVEFDLVQQVLHLFLRTGGTDELVEGMHQFLCGGIGLSLIASDIDECQCA